MRQPVPVTLLPLDTSSVLARVAKSMMEPVSGTFTNSTALQPHQGHHLVIDHEYTLFRRQSSFIAKDTRPAWVPLWVSPQFLIIFKKTSIKKWNFNSHNLSEWKILKNHRTCIAGVKQFCQSYCSWLTLLSHMLGKVSYVLVPSNSFKISQQPATSRQANSKIFISCICIT